MWTKDQLVQYRKLMEWDDLNDEQLDQVLAILNSAHTTLKSLDGVSWVEPDIGFSIKVKRDRSGQ